MDAMIILTAVLAISTVVLAYYTFLMQSEAKKSRIENTHGFVVITTEQDEDQHIYIVIKNIGLGPAFGIKLMAKNDFIYVNDYQFNSAEFTNIPLLKPNQEIRTLFGNSYQMVRDINEIITCLWTNKDTTKSKTDCIIRPKIFDHVLKIASKNSIDKLRDEVKTLNDYMARISHSMKQIAAKE